MIRSKIEVFFADQKAIGHDVGDFLNWIIASRRVKKKLKVLFYSRKHISNKYVPLFWRFFISSNDQLAIIPIPKWLLRHLIKTPKFRLNRLIVHSGVSGTQYDSIDLSSSILKFRFGNESICKDIYRRLKENERESYIILMQRSSDFHGADPARDTNIEDFLPSISYLIENGYSVLRFGMPSKEIPRFKHPNFIDMTQLKAFESEELTFSIIPDAAFAISNWYGPMELLRYYQKESFFINTPPSFRELPRRPSATVLMSNLQSVWSGELLSAEEILALINQGVNVRSAESLSRIGIHIVRHRADRILKEVEYYERCFRLSSFTEPESSKSLKRTLAVADEGAKSRRSFLEYNNQIAGNEFINLKSILIFDSLL